MPGNPAIRNAARQPYAFAIVPLTAKLRAMPIGRPSIKMLIALPRFSEGYRSPIRDVEAGAHEASPTPTPNRRANIWAKFCARPEAAVSTLQANTPAERISFRGDLSASLPNGTPTTAYNNT